MSNSLAHLLREKGIGRNDIVPIIAIRSWHVIVAMLGVMKAGGAYMPIDPEYPKDRIEYMLQTADAKFSLQYGYEQTLSIKSLNLKEVNYENNIDRVDNYNAVEDLCYIIFTSGSTGKPKGVSIMHYNVVNYSNNNKYNVCGRIINTKFERIISVTNFIFDIFVTENILPLLNGLSIYLANEAEVTQQKNLSSLISNNQVEIMQTTPTKMRSYILDKSNVKFLEQLKVIILGGEAFPSDLYEELRKYTLAERYIFMVLLKQPYGQQIQM